MLDLNKATSVVLKNLPGSTIEAVVDYQAVYLFRVRTPFPGEEDMDPFYSVDKETGFFRDFSLLTDGDIDEITKLFVEADRKKGG